VVTLWGKLEEDGGVDARLAGPLATRGAFDREDSHGAAKVYVK